MHLFKNLFFVFCPRKKPAQAKTGHRFEHCVDHKHVPCGLLRLSIFKCSFFFAPRPAFFKTALSGEGSIFKCSGVEAISSCSLARARAPRRRKLNDMEHSFTMASLLAGIGTGGSSIAQAGTKRCLLLSAAGRLLASLEPHGGGGPPRGSPHPSQLGDRRVFGGCQRASRLDRRPHGRTGEHSNLTAGRGSSG